MMDNGCRDSYLISEEVPQGGREIMLSGKYSKLLFALLLYAVISPVRCRCVSWPEFRPRGVHKKVKFKKSLA